jgi:hypothetical protein
MRKIISEFCINDYTVLTLDNDVPLKKHNGYRIDGKDYDIVPVYDMPGCIAVVGEGPFVGKTVEFVCFDSTPG